jgi:succinate dehydrogenase / fumarate reductase cytochrome b subunit
MMMSILHRLTGAANYFSSPLIAMWLIAAASGEEAFNSVNSLCASPLGLLIFFGLTWSLVHHALGGVRHFIWDTGRGFSTGSIRTLSWLTILGSLSVTAVIWFFALAKIGVL